jgi:hypothetical protein
VNSAPWLEVVYRYYPRGLWTDSPGYDHTPERARQVEALRVAGEEYPKWEAMLDRLLKRYRVQNRALHIPTMYDSAYSAELILPGARGKDYRLRFHVSILGPFYVVDRLGNPGEEAYAIDVAHEIEATYRGYEPIPRDVGDLVVPDVALDAVALGSATIYDLLLSTEAGVDRAR